MSYILYVADGRIYTIGPFDSESAAMAAGRKAQVDGEFDSRDQYVYLLVGDSGPVELTMAELDSY